MKAAINAGITPNTTCDISPLLLKPPEKLSEPSTELVGVAPLAAGRDTAGAVCADARNASHDAIVADGATNVDVNEPDPNRIADSPGRISPMRSEEAPSPPTTLTVPEESVTSPVLLLPRMNSRKKTKAYKYTANTQPGGRKEGREAT